MSTATLERPTSAKPFTPDDVHLVCDCDPDIALCGADRSGIELAPDDAPITCVDCAVLADAPCPRCGDLPIWGQEP